MVRAGTRLTQQAVVLRSWSRKPGTKGSARFCPGAQGGGDHVIPACALPSAGRVGHVCVWGPWSEMRLRLHVALAAQQASVLTWACF